MLEVDDYRINVQRLKLAKNYILCKKKSRMQNDFQGVIIYHENLDSKLAIVHIQFYDIKDLCLTASENI